MEVRLELLEVTQEPLIGRNTPGTEDNRWGFEGGFVLEEGGFVHVFTTEVYAPPKFDNTRLAHWRSKDGLTFERMSTLYDGSSPAPDELRTNLPWTPYPVYNEEEGRWNLFFTGYRGGHQAETRKRARQFAEDIGTPIIRAVAETNGRAGIGGPYTVTDYVFGGGKYADPWEGGGSAVSFFPFKVRHGWRAFFGCNQFKTRQDVCFVPGLAKSDSLSGPWERVSHLNPVLMDDRFVENPVVYPIGGNDYITFYDGETVHGIAYAYSRGGEHWSKEKVLWLESPPTRWAWWMRTPLGIIPRAAGGHWLYYSAFDYVEINYDDPEEKPWYHRGFGTVGRIGIAIHKH